MCTLKKFAEEVARVFNEQNDKKIEVVTVPKNNDVELIGWREIIERRNVYPTIYAEEYYDKVTSTDIDEEINDIQDVVEEILKIIKKPIPRELGDEIEILSEYCNVCEEVMPVLVNRKMNKKMLEDLVWKPIGKDLAIIYKIVFCANGENFRSTSITKQMLYGLWKDQDVTEEDIYENAMMYLKDHCKPYIRPMSEILREFMSHLDQEVVEKLIPEDDRMHVITTKGSIYGACAILDKELMKKIREDYGDFRLIPSSIHEWILMKIDPDTDEEALNGIINEVNVNEVKASEVLSDHYYTYEELCEDDEQGDN